MPPLNFHQFNVNAFWRRARAALEREALSLLMPTGPSESGARPSGSSPGPSTPMLSLAALFQEEALQLNPQQVSLFLKDALQLPEDMRRLFLLLALEASPELRKPAAKKTLREIIMQQTATLSLSPEEIQALLAKNTKLGQEKLMKLLQGHPTSRTQGAAQVAELATTLGKLGDKIKASPLEAMETLILLYLPWYPLPGQQQLALSFEGGEFDGEDGGKDVSFVVFLETNTLGRFKIAVLEQDPLQVVTHIGYQEPARDLMPALENHLNDLLAQDGLPAAVFEAVQISEPHAPGENASATKHRKASIVPPGRNTEVRPTATGFQGATRQADHRQVSVQAGQNVSLLVMNTAYAMARFLFEADDRRRLLQQRAKTAEKKTPAEPTDG